MTESATVSERQKLKILLIEDDVEDVIIARRYLKRSVGTDFELTHVHRLAELPDVLARQPVDAILLDLSLPDSQGMDTVQRAHAVAPRVPLVVLTGEDREQLGQQALKHGAQDFLVKGTNDMSHLARAIRYAIERTEMQRASEQAALHDDLTGLPNRLLFLDRLKMAMRRAMTSPREPGGAAGVMVAIVQLDEIDAIDEIHGTLPGDMISKTAAKRLEATVRPTDTVASFSRGEFGCVVEGVPGRAAALQMAERVQRELRQPFRLVSPRDGLVDVPIRASMGLSLFPDDARRVGRLVAAADRALYQARSAGGGRIVLPQPGPSAGRPR